MKKLLLCFGVLLIFVAGCGSSSGESTGTVEQIEGEQIVYQAGWDPEAGDDTAFSDFIREYTGENYVAQVGPLDNYTDKLMLDLASEVPINLVKVPDESFGEIISNGLALNLRPYLEEYGPNIMDNISEDAWSLVEGPNGEIYGFPALQARTDITASIMYRKDILEKEKLEVPATTDQLVDTVCTLADRGYKTPWAINWESAQYDYALRQAFGVGYWWNEDESGDLVYFGKDPRYLEFLKAANEMYECGGYGNDYETITQDDRNSRFIQGDAVFINAPYWEATLQSDGLESEGLAWKDVVGIAPALEGPDGNKSAQMDGGTSYDYTFIPTYMEPYAKQTIEFVNKLYEEDFIIQAFYGVEGETFEYDENGTPFVYPGVETPYGDGSWYKIGDFDTLSHKSYLAELNYYQEQLDAGEDIAPVSRAELIVDQDQDVGVTDPTGPAVTLTEWASQGDCANNKVIEFGDLFVTGKKTEEDFVALGEDLDNACSFQAVDEEVSTWYADYSKK